VSRMDSTPESERGRGTWRGGEIGRERERERKSAMGGSCAGV
jgi:hypothetical protein